MKPRTMKGILVEPDAPEFLENQIEADEQVVDLQSLNVGELLGRYHERRRDFVTAPFDVDGHSLRFFPRGYSIWSGQPGNGKTTLISQLACHLMLSGRRVFIASLEDEPFDVFMRLAVVALGTIDPSEDGLQWCIDAWSDRLRLWAYPRGIADHAKLLAVIRVLAKRGVSHAIIDSLERLDVSSQDFEGQRLFSNAISTTCTLSKIHLHLIAHPRKQSRNDQQTSMDDIAGAASLTRLADNILFVKKGAEADVVGEFSPMLIEIKKQRHHTGWCGSVEGYFNRRLRQFKSQVHDDLITRYLPSGAYGDLHFSDDDGFVRSPR